MNDRIEKLVKQATIIEEHGWGASYENFDKTKFAELLVRECALIAGLMEHEGRKNIGSTILDSFGVK